MPTSDRVRFRNIKAILKRVALVAVILIIAVAWNTVPVALYFQSLSASNTAAQEGIMAYRMGDYAQARVHFSSAVKQYPEHRWYVVSPLYALSFYAQADIIRNMTLARHHATIADLYMKDERFDKAREHVSVAFSYDKQNGLAKSVADKLSE